MLPDASPVQCTDHSHTRNCVSFLNQPVANNNHGNYDYTDRLPVGMRGHNMNYIMVFTVSAMQWMNNTMTENNIDLIVDIHVLCQTLGEHTQSYNNNYRENACQTYLNIGVHYSCKDTNNSIPFHNKHHSFHEYRIHLCQLHSSET